MLEVAVDKSLRPGCSSAAFVLLTVQKPFDLIRSILLSFRVHSRTTVVVRTRQQVGSPQPRCWMAPLVSAVVGFGKGFVEQKLR